MNIIKVNNQELKSCEEITQFILSNFGIKAIVKMVKGFPSIMVNHHISLATIIAKIKQDFDFVVAHKAGTDNYIIQLQTS